MKEPTDVARYLDIARLAAMRAGEFIRAKWHDERVIETKDDNSLVTLIDTGSEHLLREVFERHTPECAVLGEEQGASEVLDPKSDQLWWYIDPVDGTTNLAHRFPWICVSIALMSRGKPVVGVVYNPILEHCFSAGRGLGTTLNGAPVRVSKQRKVERALMGTGFGVGSHDTERDNVANLRHVLRSTYAVRRCGSAALDMAAVAAGWYDGYWELGLNPWDTAGAWILVEEAGGTVTDLDGSTPFNAHVPRILASNGLIHGDLAAILAESRERASTWQGA